MYHWCPSWGPGSSKGGEEKEGCNPTPLSYDPSTPYVASHMILISLITHTCAQGLMPMCNVHMFVFTRTYKQAAACRHPLLMCSFQLKFVSIY